MDEHLRILEARLYEYGCTTALTSCSKNTAHQ